MASKFGERRQKVKQYWVAIAVVALVLVIAIVLIAVGYRFGGQTGFKGKTLWDWLQLLIIPLVLAVGGFWLSQIQKDREQEAAELRAQTEREAAEKRAQIEREIAEDSQQEAVLQEYINKMSELLLDKKLRESDPDAEVGKIARVRTLTVLPRLNGKRKGTVLQFLYEAGLINKGDRIVDLTGADLSSTAVDLRGVDLSGVDLSRTNLHYAVLAPANLRGADLHQADLGAVDLSGANLSGADLHQAYVGRPHVIIRPNLRAITKGAQANLHGANLSGADLRGARFDEANLVRAKLEGANLEGATLWGVTFAQANLRVANLKGVTGITTAELEKQAESLKGATLPDGSIHP